LEAVTKSVKNILADELMVKAAKKNGTLPGLEGLGELFDENEDVIQWLGTRHCQVNGPLSDEEAKRLVKFLNQAKKLAKLTIESRTWQWSEVDVALGSSVFDGCRKRVRTAFQYATLANG